MKKRHVFALVASIVLLLVLALSSLSCVKSQAAAPVATDSLAKLSDLTAVENTLSKEIAKKADKDEASGLSEEEVQKLIDDSLKSYIKESALENWLDKNGYEKSTTGNIGDNTPSPGSEKVATNRELELYLTEISPSSDVLIFSDQQSLRMDFDVLNLSSSSSHRFEVTIYLYPDESEQNYYIDAADIYSDVSLAVPVRIPSSDSDYVCSDNADCAEPLIIKCSNGWVGKGDITSFTLACVVHVKSGTSARFDYDYSIRQTD
jgi:hypothetical protein